jgi:hypothetical protein
MEARNDVILQDNLDLQVAQNMTANLSIWDPAAVQTSRNLSALTSKYQQALDKSSTAPSRVNATDSAAASSVYLEPNR